MFSRLCFLSLQQHFAYLSSLHTKPIFGVDRCRTVDERRVALLRLVCTAPSCLFGRADTLRRRFDMLNREAAAKEITLISA